MSAYQTILQEYGADPAFFRPFESDDPGLLPYASLMNLRAEGHVCRDVDLLSVLGVYEWQNSPLMFVVDGDSIPDALALRRLRRKLALRGDAPYLGVISAGSLKVYTLSLDKQTLTQSLVPLDSSIPEAPSLRSSTFPKLIQQRPGMQNQKWIADVVLKLLEDSIRALLHSASSRTDTITRADAISLAGRALFIRFLGDRRLLPDSYLQKEFDLGTLFENRTKARESSEWLDRTFNGDILPIAPQVFDSLSPQALGALQDILRRAPEGQPYLGWNTEWSFLNFAYIPVGVLSQAYEQHMKEHQPTEQKKEGSFYTPSRIAEWMVDAAFIPLQREGIAWKARVLDPAAGAGIFLLTAFRKLVAERWRHDGIKPDTQTLRDILYQQVVGFDINEEALRFAALGLYLMAIELDPQPEPLSRLRFSHNLRNRVLIKLETEPIEMSPLSGAKQKNRDSGSMSALLGSLGRMVSDAHRGQYDLVIGNPPWTTSTGLEGYSIVQDIVQNIAKKRLTPAQIPASLLPNECLDLPFVWRAMEWAKPKGQLAFALHARVLFQQGKSMPKARQALFEALHVTGIINGMELRKTRVWPQIDAPWCILFARNHRPQPESQFRFVTPHLESSLNQAGVMRIDAANAALITASELKNRPQLFKILSRGSRLDLEVFERMVQKNPLSLEEYWGQLFGRSGGKANKAGYGYQRPRPSSKKSNAPGKQSVSAQYLHGIPELKSDTIDAIEINRSTLVDFDLPQIHRRTKREIFKGPLLIVHKSPNADRDRILAMTTDEDTVYNESYYGYSAASHPQASLLVKYVALVMGSRAALWWILMTSGEFGFEREVIEKHTIDALPIIPLERLSPAQAAQILPLFEGVADNYRKEAWQKVDQWVAELYELSPEDLQVMNDTLTFNLPFSGKQRKAESAPAPTQESTFCDVLLTELRPWLEGEFVDLRIDPIEVSSLPWRVMHLCALSREGASTTAPSRDTFPPAQWQGLLLSANQLGTTEVVGTDEPGRGLWLARLAQSRYWSSSQARLLARRIIWEHLDALFGAEAS